MEKTKERNAAKQKDVDFQIEKANRSGQKRWAQRSSNDKFPEDFAATR